MPSKPGYETLSQARSSRQTKVVGWPGVMVSQPILGLQTARLRLTQFVRFAPHPPDGLLIAVSRASRVSDRRAGFRSRYRRGGIRPVHGNKDAHTHPAVTLR